MKLVSLSRRRSARACVAALGTFAALAAAPTASHAQKASDWPSQVKASYKLHFSAIGEVGTLNFQSNITPQGYVMNADAQVKIPLIYSWSSQSNATGQIQGEAPLPSTFNFKALGRPTIGSDKRQTISFDFKDRVAGNVVMDPAPSTGSSNYVPLKDGHTKDVVDPLGAMIMLTRVKGDANPCNRRLPIFDGKQRFDLVLSSAGKAAIPEAHPSGLPTQGYVCKVRYLPIGGYKNNDDTRRMVAQNGVQILFRSVPSANMVVPYQITVPTPAGTATMTLQRMDIVANGQKQIALVH
jgi:hypothetical protein